jgi:hypothetical protein
MALFSAVLLIFYDFTQQVTGQITQTLRYYIFKQIRNYSKKFA